MTKLALLICAAILPLTDSAQAAAPIPVMILDGQSGGPYHDWLYHCLEGEIALAAGDRAAAEAAFVAGEPEFKPFISGPVGWPVALGR